MWERQGKAGGEALVETEVEEAICRDAVEVEDSVVFEFVLRGKAFMAGRSWGDCIFWLTGVGAL
jgi:hypothetical protein